MYINDEQAVRDAIATYRNKIEQERAFTVDHIGRLRRFMKDRALERRECEEWRHFHERTYVMERDIEVMMRALATAVALRQPAPFIIPQSD